MLRDIDPKSARLSRRHLLVVGSAVAASGSALALTQSADANELDLSGIKALVFDVYGTCTDYWDTIVREGQAINRKKGLDIDWGRLATNWHGLFPPGFAAVLKRERPGELRLASARGAGQCRTRPGNQELQQRRIGRHQYGLAACRAVVGHDPWVAPQICR